MPIESEEVENVATPLPFKALVPNEVVPSMNVTEPVGVPPVPVTVAVNVTDAPAAEGLAEETRAGVPGFNTVSDTDAEGIPFATTTSVLAPSSILAGTSK